jgi:hypothetical protein
MSAPTTISFKIRYVGAKPDRTSSRATRLGVSNPGVCFTELAVLCLLGLPTFSNSMIASLISSAFDSDSTLEASFFRSLCWLASNSVPQDLPVSARIDPR